MEENPLQKLPPIKSRSHKRNRVSKSRNPLFFYPKSRSHNCKLLFKTSHMRTSGNRCEGVISSTEVINVTLALQLRTSQMRSRLRNYKVVLPYPYFANARSRLQMQTSHLRATHRNCNDCSTNNRKLSKISLKQIWTSTEPLGPHSKHLYKYIKHTWTRS